jgi:hypothetical protein
MHAPTKEKLEKDALNYEVGTSLAAFTMKRRKECD